MNATRPAVVIALAAALAGCGGAASSASPGATASPAVSPSPQGGPMAEFEPIELGGTGDDIAAFSIPDGAAAIATFRHTGDDAFVVDAVAADGTQLENLVDAVGRYAGTVLIAAEGGQATALKVVTTGAWTATIAPVNAARGWDGVGKLEGRNDDVVLIDPPTAGVTPWHVVHDGGSTFVVDAYAADGPTNVISEIGTYEGDIRVVGGTYLLTVRSEGVWSFYVLM